MECHKHVKIIAITAGAIGGVALIGTVAAMIWNSKQMKTVRTIKRASKIMYHVGTAMRNLSGEVEGI